MTKKIENYIHLYLGCKVKATTMGLIHTFNTYNNDNTVKHFKDGSFKLVLRPLSDLTEEEFNKLSKETGFKGIHPMDSNGVDDFVNRSIAKNDWKVVVEASNWLRRNGFDLDCLIENEFALNETSDNGVSNN